jgi:hypothetical protein
MARTGSLCTAAAAQKLLYDAVFKTVKGDNSQTATGLQHTLSSLKAIRQFVQFAVHMNANGLEGTGSRIFRRTRLVTNSLANNRCQLRSGFYGPRRNNRSRYTA